MTYTNTNTNNHNHNTRSNEKHQQPQQQQSQEPKPPLWNIWLLAARPHTLTASIAPCLVGHCLTYPKNNNSNDNNMTTTLSWMAFCMLIQLATNLHNDYADFVKGADTSTRVGQARATQRGWLTPTETAGGATVCLVAALAVGIPLITDSYMLAIVITSAFNAVAYTGGPYPLGYLGLQHVSIAYSGMGDVFCFLYFGVVATCVVPYLRAAVPSALTLPVFIQSLPMGFLSTNILVVNNLRDRHTDVVANKRTVAVRFGPTVCRVEYTLFVLWSFGVAIWTWSHNSNNNNNNYWSLLPLVTIPLSIPCIKAVWTLEGADLNPYVGASARLELAYSILQCVGLVMGAR